MVYHKMPIIFFMLLALFVSPSFAEKKVAPAPIKFDISQSVLKQALAEDVTPEDAIEAMKSKAVALNMKFVAHQPLSTELNSRGVKSARLEIFQFCTPLDARKMVSFNPVFAAYMPCRIALVEDEQGKNWLMMLNLDMLINSTPLPDEVRKIAVKVSTNLKAIIDAAASGDF